MQRCWAIENGFKFSKTKTQCVLFCQIRQLHLDPHLTIYGSSIPVVSEAKFLGLLFDNKLSFIPHIKALKAKCLKALDILKVLSNSDWEGERHVLLNLYRSLIRSKLDFGSIIYGSARKSYLKSLDTIHHRGLRLALGAFRTSPVESLYAESNEPSLYIRREKLSLQYVTKLAANPRYSAYDSVFHPKYERFYTNKSSAIKPLGLRIKPLLQEAHIDTKRIQFIIFSDSLSVLKSLKNLNHSNPLIQQILRKYFYLSTSKEIIFCWLPSHINIRGNEIADQEAKAALSSRILNFKIPHSDFKSNIHQYISNKC